MPEQPTVDSSVEDLYIGEDRLRMRAVDLPRLYPDGVTFDGGASAGLTFTTQEPLHGATAVVLRAQTMGHASVDRALKVLLVDIEDEMGRQRWLRECELLRRVHKVRGAPSVHRTGELRGMPAIVMDWAPGETLDEYFKRVDAFRKVADADDARLRLEEAAELIVELLRTLAAMYADLEESGHPGPVHRDLKPQNIKRQPGARSGKPKITILDFGEASFGEESQLRGSTPMYVSPEQRLERFDAGPARCGVDHRADQYAVGVILQRLLEPLRHWVEAATPTMHAERKVVARVRAVLAAGGRMAARDPRDRFADFAAAADALRRAAAPARHVPSRMAMANIAVVFAALLIAFLLGRENGPVRERIVEVPRPAPPVVANGGNNDGRKNGATNGDNGAQSPVAPPVRREEQISIIRDWYDRLTVHRNATRDDLLRLRDQCVSFVERFPDDPAAPGVERLRLWLTDALQGGRVRITPVRFIEDEFNIPTDRDHVMSFSISIVESDGTRRGPITGSETVEKEAALEAHGGVTAAWDPNARVEMFYQHDRRTDIQASQQFHLDHRDVLTQATAATYRFISAVDDDFKFEYRIERLGFGALPSRP